jgi:F420-non-reducing hydrogenase small subunit
MAKLRVGVYWAASCGGCDVSLLEIDEQLLDVVDHADLSFWPCATDTKYSDLRRMREQSLDLVLINGAIRTSENRELVELLRQKSKLLVAYGACAQSGGVIGLANLSRREEIFTRVYGEQDLWPKTRTKVDGHTLTLPDVAENLLSLDQVVNVDYTIPGCPPPKEVISNFFDLVVRGELPPRGAVFASEKNLCAECPRERTEERITAFFRPHELEPEAGRCLLDQGMLCMGPATRGGCGAACPNANMPCTGCAGPPAGVRDQGAAMLNTVASLVGTGVESEDQFEAENAILRQVADLYGTFYRFNIASSIFRGDRRE